MTTTNSTNKIPKDTVITITPVLFLLFFSIFVLSIIQPVYAHPGRTAGDGCHYCRTNCGSWGGTAYNQRHCHQSKGVPQPYEPIRSHRDGTYEVWEAYKKPKPNSQYFGNTNSKFTRTLSVGSVGEDVRRLQKYLNTRGFTVSTTGAGSLGNETYYFGPKTKQALIDYQNVYRVNILEPIGLFVGTGNFGKMTMQHMNNE